MNFRKKKLIKKVHLLFFKNWRNSSEVGVRVTKMDRVNESR